MSYVSRSVYQKVCEENKRLMRSIRLLTYDAAEDESINEFKKWFDYFETEEAFNNLFKHTVKQYIKNHADELPDFLTNKNHDE